MMGADVMPRLHLPYDEYTMPVRRPNHRFRAASAGRPCDRRRFRMTIGQIKRLIVRRQSGPDRADWKDTILGEIVV